MPSTVVGAMRAILSNTGVGRVGKGRLTVVIMQKFILVLFISYCIVYLYYNSKPTFAKPYIQHNGVIIIISIYRSRNRAPSS